MTKPKLQKKWINWFMEQHDIHIQDHIQQCRTGYSGKSWMKKRHFKKQEQAI